MCTAYPNRSAELDAYLAHIIETANIWPERFHEYHQLFSNKCACMLLQHNVKIDWSKGDPDLRSIVCAGSAVNTCLTCGSNIHSTNMCSLKNVRRVSSSSRSSETRYNARNNTDMHGLEIVYHRVIPFVTISTHLKAAINHTVGMFMYVLVASIVGMQDHNVPGKLRIRGNLKTQMRPSLLHNDYLVKNP
jgi:hypothetical protein